VNLPDPNSLIGYFEVLEAKRNSLVVYPSLLEFESFLLYDLIRTGVPFIASRAWFTDGIVPYEYTFPINHNALITKLKSILDFGFEWKPIIINTSASQRERLFLKAIETLLSPSKATHEMHFDDGNSAREFSHPLNVSVSISICNRVRYLEELLASIISQTYPHELIDIIFVFVCSDIFDCTYLDKAHYLTDAPFRIRCRSFNTYSLGQARNAAVSVSKADLIVFIDDDNFMYPNALASFVRSANLNPDRSVFSGWTAITKSDPSNARVWTFCGDCPSAGAFKNVLGDSFLAVRRKEFIHNQPFTEDPWTGCEDWEFLLKSSIGKKYVFSPEILLGYRASEKERMSSWVQNAHMSYRCRTRAVSGFDKIFSSFILSLYDASQTSQLR